MGELNCRARYIEGVKLLSTLFLGEQNIQMRHFGGTKLSTALFYVSGTILRKLEMGEPKFILGEPLEVSAPLIRCYLMSGDLFFHGSSKRSTDINSQFEENKVDASVHVQKEPSRIRQYR